MSKQRRCLIISPYFANYFINRLHFHPEFLKKHRSAGVNNPAERKQKRKYDNPVLIEVFLYDSYYKHFLSF